MGALVEQRSKVSVEIGVGLMCDQVGDELAMRIPSAATDRHESGDDPTGHRDLECLAALLDPIEHLSGGVSKFSGS